MPSLKVVLISATLLLSTVALATDSNSTDNPEEMTVESIKQNITDKHPLNYIILASMLFNEGQKDEAVKWYYIGQIRFRAYLNANPDLAASGDPALYSSLKYVVGTPINEYAGQNPDNWAKLIKDAITWHRNNPNGFMPKSENVDIYTEIENSFIELYEWILLNKEEIRRQRADNGLINK